MTAARCRWQPCCAKAWADSLAFIAATWSDDQIEDDPERIAEALFAHIHGVVFFHRRRRAPPRAARSVRHGLGCHGVRHPVLDGAEGNPRSGGRDRHQGTVRDGRDLVRQRHRAPLAIELAQANEDGWDRSLFELFPDFRHSADLADAEYLDDPDEEPTMLQRSTKELLYRLRKQVPSTQRAAFQHAAAWARAFSRNESRELLMLPAIVVENLPRLVRAIKLLPGDPREDAALNLADELTGITSGHGGREVHE